MTDHAGGSPGQQVLFSTSEEYYPAAKRELLDLYGAEQVTVDRLGPDLGRLSGEDVRLGQVAEDCRHRPLAFVKHLTAEVARLPLETAADLDAVAEAVQRVAGGPGELALQAWVSGQNPLPYETAELAKRCTAVLAAQGVPVRRAGAPRTLSLCVTQSGLLLGMATTADQLSDWPGGRSRLAKGRDQISRAEFKLEEAFQTFAVVPPAGGTAVDLGASPGGWTRILRGHGLTVYAVDPGDLDDRLRQDRGVRHIRTTAGEFFRNERQQFDMVVDDMKMAPELSCRIVLDAAERLRPGGMAVITLKLSPQRPVDTVRHCLALLAPRYRVRAARQLHHNRHEVTVVAERR
ncbi:SAM-dependent methyltransferase [Amycolatopsis nigrescens]|uniref:SAM-dependent methyltransferase n=1 Tax=Amycolatopsis nigrescens TaxID=381445 RepID=UPI0003AAF3C2|nr:SAM-dependent methyltransferase [Amycolatopsis nigrescens]